MYAQKKKTQQPRNKHPHFLFRSNIYISISIEEKIFVRGTIRCHGRKHVYNCFLTISPQKEDVTFWAMDVGNMFMFLQIIAHNTNENPVQLRKLSGVTYETNSPIRDH